jgi:hypothetical protein
MSIKRDSEHPQHGQQKPVPDCGLACVFMHVAMRAVAQARRGLGASACVCFTVGETALTCEESPVPLESVSRCSVSLGV